MEGIRLGVVVAAVVVGLSSLVPILGERFRDGSGGMDRVRAICLLI